MYRKIRRKKRGCKSMKERLWIRGYERMRDKDNKDRGSS
jgi:hypothetical protein